MTISCEFRSSYFFDCHSSNNGGVMEISKKVVKVVCCFFTNTSCKYHGGSILTNESSTTISKTVFIGCYSTAKNANYQGNAVKLDGIKCFHIIENCVTYKCGPSYELYSDTAIFSGGTTKLLLYNATHNYGRAGASGININNGDSQPQFPAKFVTISTGYDNRFYEQAKKDITLDKFNFINSTDYNDRIVDVNTCKVTLTSCIFSQINKPLRVNVNNVIFFDCLIDTPLPPTISGIEKVANLETFSYSPNLECVVKVNTNPNNQLIYKFQTICIFNSILVKIY